VGLFLKEIYTKQVLVLNSFKKHSEHPGYWAGARFLGWHEADIYSKPLL
jgi:hypothetical protein